MTKFAPIALTIAAVCTSSCALWHKKAAAAPPVITSPPNARQANPEPPQLPPPPKVDTPPSTQVPAAPTSAAQNPPQIPRPPAVQQPKPPRRQKKAVAAKPLPAEPAPQASGPASGPAAAPASSLPQLTQMLSPGEQLAYNRAIDAALQKANANVARISGRPLDSSQQASLERIQAFLREAQAARPADLVTAKSFADRAAILSQDLVKSLGR